MVNMQPEAMPTMATNPQMAAKPFQPMCRLRNTPPTPQPPTSSASSMKRISRQYVGTAAGIASERKSRLITGDRASRPAVDRGMLSSWLATCTNSTDWLDAWPSTDLFLLARFRARASRGARFVLDEGGHPGISCDYVVLLLHEHPQQTRVSDELQAIGPTDRLRPRQHETLAPHLEVIPQVADRFWRILIQASNPMPIRQKLSHVVVVLPVKVFEKHLAKAKPETEPCTRKARDDKPAN